jgi:oligopeptide/dipeptide ABC transporter ATP-binding protein
MAETILKVENLKTYFYTYEGVVKALEGINFELKRGKTLGMVGETGCGKSVTALSIMNLIPDPPGKIIDGKVVFRGSDLLKLSGEEIRKIRGKDISMIFQEPMMALNPVYSIGDQISETLLLHDIELGDVKDKREKKKKAMKKVYGALRLVGISDPERMCKSYPHELSGGMCQRAMIAMAMVCNPSLLIADEPTTALDVTIQAQILELMKKLVNDFGSSVLLITHNLGVVAETCDEVAVMYAGRIVEQGSVIDVFKHPLHPYTTGLMEAIPTVEEKRDRIETIPGSVPNLISPPSGCRFHPRCSRAMNICSKKVPKLLEVKGGHKVACWVYEGR